MTRALLTLLAVLALAPASASAATTGTSNLYGYGLDAYLVCAAEARTATAHTACANELALDLTDGGQLRRAPICLRNRTTEWVSGENHNYVGTAANCLEEYLGTKITPLLPRALLPPPGL